MIRKWAGCVCLLMLFTMMGVKYTFAAEPDLEKMQQMKEELERMAEGNSDVIDSEEFNKLADSYVEMLINSKGQISTGVFSEYIIDPPVTAEVVSGQFKFTLPNRQNFYSSIPNGTIITAPVQFTPVENALTTIKKDGKVIPPPLSGNYTETGNYEVKMVAYGDANVQLEEFNVYEVMFSFRIIDPYTKDVNYLYPPEEYAISMIRCDGESGPVSGKGEFLEKDGNYEIEYKSSVYPQQSYRFRFTRDTQPPDIMFIDGNAGNEYDAPAEFKVSEPLQELHIVHNGMSLENPSYILQSEGNYYITAVDQAGNQSEILVRINKQYPFWGSVWIIVIIVFLAASIGFVLYYRRKNIRIL